MFHCSSAEGQRFQEEVTRISNIIENLGKNPLKETLSSSNQDKSSNSNKKPKTE